MEATSTEATAKKQQEPQFNEAMVQTAMEGFRADQNLIGGALAGLAAAAVGAAVWAAVTVVTDYQIGWMAVGVGFIVGMAMRAVGKGIDKVFGVIGAGLALFGCLLGNVLTIVYFVSKAVSLGYFETFSRMNPATIPDLMVATFSPIDLLFYGIALYEGFKLSFRKIGPEELESAIKGVPSAATQPS